MLGIDILFGRVLDRIVFLLFRLNSGRFGRVLRILGFYKVWIYARLFVSFYEPVCYYV